MPGRVHARNAKEKLVYRPNPYSVPAEHYVVQTPSVQGALSTAESCTTADVKSMCIEMQRQSRSAKFSNGGGTGMRGIWCSKEQWARIQRLLETRLETVQGLRYCQAQMQAAHHLAIENGKLDAFAKDQRFIEQQGQHRMQVLERDSCIAQLRDELACCQKAHAEDCSRLTAQTSLADERATQLEQMQTQRIQEKAEVEGLKAELRDANERCQLIQKRNEGLSEELKSAKSTGWKAVQDAESKAANVAELSAQQDELRQRVEFYQKRLSERAVPSVELQQENSRLHGDCKRLMALLETTSEYQHWVGREAALQGLHYMPMAECFSTKGVTSDVYPPNLDRTVDLEVEECHWVPKDVVKHMMALLREVPQLPTAPFMGLLAELNKVWKQREAERVREVQLQHERDLSDFRRLHQQATPYQQSVMHDKLEYLRRELKSSHQHARTLSKYKAKMSDQLADDSKSLLRWSLAQIEGLVDETKRLTQENAILWGKAGAQQAVHPDQAPRHGGRMNCPFASVNVNSLQAEKSKTRGMSTGKVKGSPSTSIKQ